MSVTLRAPAKLTLSLRLTGVRSDGYHLIDAEMVTLELCDLLTFTDGDTLTLSGPFAAGLPTDGGNLVCKALAAVGRTAAVHVVKHIPAQGGLGGGSADAAAVLRWASCDDLALATSLGADVPFCVAGGRARVTGIGDVLVRLPIVERTFTLVIPPVGVSTVAAYKAWDAMGGPTGNGANDLELAAMVVEPTLRRWRDRIAEAAGVAPTLAGSGSTWFLDGHVDGLAAAMPEAIIIQTRTDRPSERAAGRSR
jgi:4-diphosphocytidyl-2-C-methyl-D-erythritol kinase